MTQTALWKVLALRELRGQGAIQRLLFVATAAIVFGYLSVGPARADGARRLASTLQGYEEIAVFVIGVTTALRMVSAMFDDQRDGWMSQLFAAGPRRDLYLAGIATAALLGACVDLLVAFGIFALIHAAAGVGLGARLLTIVPTAIPWLAAAIGVAAALAMALNDRARTRAATLVVLLLPYLVMYVFGQFSAGEATPDPVIRFIMTALPMWVGATPITYAWRFLLYASIAFAAAVYLAPARIERST